MAEGGVAAERESRRRKIAERGSDRMALITGRVQNLPPPQSPSQPLPPLPNPNRSPSTALMDQSSSTKFSRGRAFNYRKAEPPLPKRDTNTRTSTTPARDTQPKDQKQPVTAPPKMSTSSTARNQNLRKPNNICSLKEINTCIVATESTRIFCSAIIALFVVILNINLPKSIVKSTSAIASRPLYILLVSDATIVIKKLLQKRRDSEKFEDGENSKDGSDLLEAVKILEIGLVFYQAIRALFIDLSCYTVVIICGLCLF